MCVYVSSVSHCGLWSGLDTCSALDQWHAGMNVEFFALNQPTAVLDSKFFMGVG